MRAKQAWQVFRQPIGEVRAGCDFAASAKPFTFREARFEVEVLAVNRTAELAGDKKGIARLAGPPGQDAVRETLDGERRRKGTSRGATNIAADYRESGLGGGPPGTMGKINQPRRVYVGPDEKGKETVRRAGTGGGQVA